ncbi:A24 family peptidase [Sulfurospirillum sp. UCH001]|uniref:prepilin peptidase n=1 Tax=Sulfurospirillum sp. UCH001 TaxID=1581011 RepID=UPI0008367C71|nr:A24 family peptidase [Sulfurospirillum sp. UCH001]
MEGVLVTLFGLCIGSFLNVAIIRLPKNESINLPASHCPTCLHPLAWYHNVPLFSWIFLRGKCAFCRSHISFQYPLVELSSAFLYAFIYFYLANTLQALLIASVFALLLALSIIDLRYKAVPDALSLPALILSFCTGDPLVSLQNGLLFMGAFAFLRFFISALAKKEVMGEADIIIAGIIGALLGIKLGLVAIYISAVIALIIFMIIRKKGYELAFIPFLALGLLLTWLFETPILHIMELIYE